MNEKTVIYVNFAPYENAGEILTFLHTTFSTVLLFSFNFHKLSDSQRQSQLTVFKKGQIVYTHRLFQTISIPAFTFILLPVRSIIIFLQLFWHTARLAKIYGPYDIYFTVNAFTAWTGNILRNLRLVKKTVFWVWDYYPPKHEDPFIMFMRWAYWMFDKSASLSADRTIFLNKRLESLRKTIGILPQTARYASIPIGTILDFTQKKISSKSIRIVFLGVLKKSHGLDLFFECISHLSTKLPKVILVVIGGGPDELRYRSLANNKKIPVIFHGYVPDDKIVNKILKQCHIGIAPYLPDKNAFPYHSDPSKIKRYLSIGLPVITTGVFDFSKEINNDKAGIVISYNPEELAEAIQTIFLHYTFYKKHAKRLAERYIYNKIYPDLFI